MIMSKSTLSNETAGYIRDMAAELAVLAESNDLQFVGYLFRLVEAELKERATRAKPSLQPGFVPAQKADVASDVVSARPKRSSAAPRG
jgi:hypothetical protein